MGAASGALVACSYRARIRIVTDNVLRGPVIPLTPPRRARNYSPPHRRATYRSRQGVRWRACAPAARRTNGAHICAEYPCQRDAHEPPGGRASKSCPATCCATAAQRLSVLLLCCAVCCALERRTAAGRRQLVAAASPPARQVDRWIGNIDAILRSRGTTRRKIISSFGCVRIESSGDTRMVPLPVRI